MASKAKAIIDDPTPKGNSAPVSLEEAGRKISTTTKRNSAGVKRKQKEIAEGDSGKIPVNFTYADGSIQRVKLRAFAVRTMGILVSNQKDEKIEVSLSSNGKRVVGGKVGLATKPLRVSFGRARKTVKTKNGTKTRISQNWQTVGIPQDATFLDALAWIKTWKKQPGLVRLGQQEVVISLKRARGASAGATAKR